MNTVDSHMLPFIHTVFRLLHSDAYEGVTDSFRNETPLRVIAHDATTKISFPCFYPLITVMSNRQIHFDNNNLRYATDCVLYLMLKGFNVCLNNIV